jgi:D-glycero-alpha-D-manno-heptose-7-phosphate kinase
MSGGIIRSTAPVRIADNGGWTDTWFARHGQVLNIAVTPGVDITLEHFNRDCADATVTLRLKNPDLEYTYEPGSGVGGHNRLLEAAIDLIGIPDAVAVRIDIVSDVPSGASTGTSASVTVALLAALARLHGRTPSSMDLAMAAHHVEMDILGWQCGVQDQLAAAFGGVNFISIDRFPAARVEQLALPPDLLRQLEERLLLVFLGASHQSAKVHRMVIEELEHEGEASPRLEVLRRCATDARGALLAGDLDAFGKSLSCNTEAQARLHPALIGEAAQRVIDAAAAHGASGWKVNGAGGDGGSVTILCGSGALVGQRMCEAIADVIPASKSIPVTLSPHGAQAIELPVRRVRQ